MWTVENRTRYDRSKLDTSNNPILERRPADGDLVPLRRLGAGS